MLILKVLPHNSLWSPCIYFSLNVNRCCHSFNTIKLSSSFQTLVTTRNLNLEGSNHFQLNIPKIQLHAPEICLSPPPPHLTLPSANPLGFLYWLMTVPLLNAFPISRSLYLCYIIPLSLITSFLVPLTPYPCSQSIYCDVLNAILLLIHSLLHSTNIC